ncbi:hypothetical protein [Hyphomicrobium sp. ghe19]|uniref:hypothetical protein n=1 Tax=Hyphomicrobium sp. ghe19 TaxID=2682968 RepID=UPI001366DD25|nr:hypothetical protein HYPP_01613 [Hyphomicrobium sp. ghe19]
MSKKLLSLFAGGALALSVAAYGAAAAPINPGGFSRSTSRLEIPVRSGGGGMHGGFGGMHAGHMMGGPRFAGPSSHRHIADRHRHHHNRFFFAGYPYYYYDDGYDDDYDGSCWWSRSHRRWICGD